MRFGRFTLAAALAATLCAASAAAGQAATITVNSIADTTADDGACTLREAITAANTDTASGAVGGECSAGQDVPVMDTIAFSIAGPGSHMIVPATALPLFSDPITLDGSTEPDPVELNGQNLSGDALLNVLAADSVVRGLFLHSHQGGAIGSDAAIQVQGPNVTVEDVTLGITSAGVSAPNMSRGINAGTNADDIVIRDSLIRDSTFDGITLSGPDRAQVTGNLIGTDDTGNTAAGNNVGVRVEHGADDVVIGGPDPADGNVIAASNFDGVHLSWTPGFDAMSDVLIQNNLIGVGADGTTALGNGGQGVHSQGDVQSAEVRDNVISGNDDQGVLVEQNNTQDVGDDGPSDWVIAGNRIGTDAAGATEIPNGATDPAIEIIGSAGHPAERNLIGGTQGLTAGGSCTGDCNLIATGGAGVELDEATQGEADDIVDTSILGNHIGTDITGLTDIGTELDTGVRLDGAHDTQVGSAAAPNVISGAEGVGVLLTAGDGHTVAGNLIGVGADGTTAVGNGGDGVYLVTDTTDNLIGGDGQGNVIANNGGDGVFATGAGTDRNAMLANSVGDNAELGIDLDTDGVTPNDAQDPDTGSNDQQNFPVLTAAIAESGTIVAGTLNSLANTEFRLDFYASPAGDASGNGEGLTHLGFTNVTTGGGGGVAFAEILPVQAGADTDISATATRIASGVPIETSEFSATINEGLEHCDASPTNGPDVICGGAGSDVLDGEGGNDIVIGFGGDDSLAGSGGHDLLVGGEGADTGDYSNAPGPVTADLADGEAASDGGGFVDELSGLENLVGGTAGDTLAGDDSPNSLDGGAGEDVLTGFGGEDDLDGGEDDDDLDGGAGGDDLTGTGGADTLDGGDGDDTLTGGDDTDNLEGGDGEDDLTGGDGDDTLEGEDGGDVLSGDGGDDILRGGDGNDTLDSGDGADDSRGDAGSDTVRGDGGNDYLTGGDGNDVIQGGDGDDEGFGNSGSDTVNGNAGNDFLGGADGNDTLKGEAGADTLKGQAGSDVAFGGDGKDTFLMGDGNDTAKGNAGNDKLYGGNGSDLLSGQAGFDTAVGHAGNDTLFGGDKKDTLKGLNGADKLRGNNGDDVLRGGNGKDQLLGHAGKDSLWTQAGNSELCNGGGGSDKTKTTGCEIVKLIP